MVHFSGKAKWYSNSSSAKRSNVTAINSLSLSRIFRDSVFICFLIFCFVFLLFFLANLNYSKPYTNSIWTGNLGRWVVVKYLLENRREEKISSLKSLNFHMKLIGFQNQFEIQFLFYKNNPFPKLFISLLTLMWVLLFDSKSTKTK